MTFKTIVSDYSFVDGTGISNLDRLTVIQQRTADPPLGAFYIKGIDETFVSPLLTVVDANSEPIFTVQTDVTKANAVQSFGTHLFEPDDDRVRTRVVANASQTVDLSQWRNVAGGLLARVSFNGRIHGMGLLASGLTVGQVGDATLLDDAPNLDQVNVMASGHHASKDPHTWTPVLDPATTSKNTIAPADSAVIPFNIVAGIGTSVDVQRWERDTTWQDKIDKGGKFWAVGMDAQDRKISSVASGTLLDDAVNVDQMNRSLSGHFDYWEKSFQHNLASTNITAVVMQSNDQNTSDVGMPVGRDCRVVMIGVNSWHNDAAGDPGPWDVQVIKNGSTNAATFQWGFDNAINTDRVCASGVPPLADFVAGDEYRVIISGAIGSAVDNPNVRVTLGFRSIADIR